MSIRLRAKWWVLSYGQSLIGAVDRLLDVQLPSSGPGDRRASGNLVGVRDYIPAVSPTPREREDSRPPEIDQIAGGYRNAVEECVDK